MSASTGKKGGPLPTDILLHLLSYLLLLLNDSLCAPWLRKNNADSAACFPSYRQFVHKAWVTLTYVKRSEMLNHSSSNMPVKLNQQLKIYTVAFMDDT